MPFAKKQVRDEAGGEEDDHARHRQQDERREQARNVEPELRFQQPEGEAGAGARGAGCELRHHRGNQRQPAGDPQAGEEIGERVRDLQVNERLPAAGAVELEQVEEVVVGGAQALRGVGQHREEGDDPGADEDRALRGRRIDDDERRNGDDGRHLQDHGIGIERQLDPSRLRHQDRQRHGAGNGDGERHERDLQRHQERAGEDRPVLHHGLRHAHRARQDVMRHLGGGDVNLPGGHEQQKHRGRHENARDPRRNAAVCGCGSGLALGLLDRLAGICGSAQGASPAIAFCNVSETRRQFSA